VSAVPDADLSLQQLVGAAERLRARESGSRVDWLASVEEAHDRVCRRPFEALPIPAFVHQEGAKERIVSSPEPGDRLIEEALLPLLHAAFDPLLLSSCHSYRAGRSTFTAINAASAALAAGHRWVALLDVADYFGSIDRDLLGAQMVAALPASILEIITALLAAPLRLKGQLVERPRGIPLGCPLSPLLANLHLVPLDEAMQDLDGTYLRYGDDLFMATRERAARDQAEERATNALASLGLRLHPEKTEKFAFEGSPIVWLGHAVDAKGVYERVASGRLKRILEKPVAAAPDAPTGDLPGTEAHPNRRSCTLYVTEPGLYLSIDAGMVVARRARQVVREVPLRTVDRVLVLSGAAVSSGFMAACISHDVPVLFFVGKGRAYGSLVASGMPNPLRLRSQYDLLSQPGRRLALARTVIHSKLDAMLRRMREAPPELREHIAEGLSAVASAADPAVLRGHEGNATRNWYEAWGARIHNPDFAFRGRSKRPPRDAVNSLLSFSYSLLFAEMQTALLADGLDPFPGLLHELHPAHPALASDLLEPYRVTVADSFVLRLVNTGRVRGSGFEKRGEGVYMNADTRRDVLESYESFMHRGGEAGSPRRLLHAAARSMLRVVLGEASDLSLPLIVTEIDDAGAEVLTT
jgi:CRISPR-associated protein Cas1